MNDEQATEVAVFKYGVIAPFLDQHCDDEEKARHRRRVLNQEHEIPHTRRKRIAARTLREWVFNYKRFGLEALKPKKRSDKGKPRVFDVKTLERAIELKEEKPERSVDRVIEILVEEGTADEGEIKASTLSRHFNLLDMTYRKLKVKTGFKRYELDRVNAQWQSDVKYAIFLPDPENPEKSKRTYLVAFLDDYSRFVPHAEFYFDENLPALEDCLKKAVLKGGIPDRIYVDNGQIYRSNHFKAVCAELGMRHIFASPYSPQAKGKVERLFRTVEESFLSEARSFKPKTLKQLNEYFKAWLEEYYHEREHSGIGTTPKNRFASEDVRYPEPDKLYEAFLQRERRTVDKTGCVSVNGRLYETKSELIGKRVQVRFDPFDKSKVRIYYEGSFLHEARTISSGTTLEKKERPKKKVSANYLELIRRKHERNLKKRAKRISYKSILGDEDV